MSGIEDAARTAGFENAAEMRRLVCEVRLASPQDIWDFKRWQDGDGTKEGLLALLERQKPPKRDFAAIYPRVQRCPEHGLVLEGQTNRQTGRRFLGCPRYPLCRHTEDLPDEIDDEEDGF